MLIGLSAPKIVSASDDLTTISDHPTLPTNLLAYWKLEEASGTREDSVGSIDLTDTNTVLQGTGIRGNCGDFEKTNFEYLTSASNLASTIGSGSYSASMWVNPESISTAQATYGAGILTTRAAEANGSFAVTVKSDGSIYWYRWTGTDARYKTSAAHLSTLGVWYHIVITYNSTGPVHTMYVNGSSVSFASDGSPATGWGTNTQIGTMYTTSSFAWDGLIDEVGIWGKELTSSEVTDLYNGGSGLPYN